MARTIMYSNSSWVEFELVQELIANSDEWRCAILLHHDASQEMHLAARQMWYLKGKHGN